MSDPVARSNVVHHLREPLPQRIDLETVRATLSYMHDDMCGVPALAGARAALAEALQHIERIAPAAAPAPKAALARRLGMRFVPWRPDDDATR